MTSREQLDNEHREEEDGNIEKWIPEYLKMFVIPYHDEFCYTRFYHFRLVAALMMEGFLPIATKDAILPKLHHERSVISLPEALHVSKSTRKKSKKFRLTVNQNFDRVVEECHKQHGQLCWLYPDLVKLFKEIHEAGKVNVVVNPISNLSAQRQKTAPVRMYSIEVWNDETRELVAGELGYTVGNIYTSLTGFSAQDSAGSVQLVSLGRLLSNMGFKFWDLGMDMEYKQDLGSHLMKRKDFVSFVAKSRVTDGNKVLPTTNSNGFNCKSLVDQTLSLEILHAGGEQIQMNVGQRGTNGNRQECKLNHTTSNDQIGSSHQNKKKRRSFLNKSEIAAI
uniref:Leucyl/phenylalanyl-tRNA--protein transferase n=1 Tax=Pseudo-nitzschia australis TaxID=44445 RepID=A0A7S4EM55_9STRA|mmetsp:Transcript_4855/g.10705  ORF Transcript_4855/g.10705 Transcript_4855/m.10705 type:complete len:336 (-) Transcript_4855:1104-2111(-)|eukprot:CAMPEP_0168169214 /NCGR_PEP_ID=MMETSP0139_2-20121125/3521_1 /TAXON_ID=44445 /ORGANISM="Pseudo-nitzschia australis, Strain 10249 10 AB" /LENGTH=335 /DNA_ID=CAMNT_0008086623 /DNA_START=108 /DNA_END=1115 /DNA_ORIENTATION=-